MSLCSAILLAMSITALILGLLTITSSSLTTTTKGFVLLTSKNEVIYSLWNTTAGTDGKLSTLGPSTGNYNPNETPQNAFDQNSTTKHSSYGNCNNSFSAVQCGTDTDSYVISYSYNSLPARDPMTITIEGSNQPSSVLLFDSSWTLIYSGSSGLDSDPNRYGYDRNNSNNIVWYNNYRLVITSKRNISNAAQYSEVELLGY